MPACPGAALIPFPVSSQLAARLIASAGACSARLPELDRGPGPVPVAHVVEVAVVLELEREEPLIVDLLQGPEERRPVDDALPEEREREGLAEDARPPEGVLHVHVPDLVA